MPKQEYFNKFSKSYQLLCQSYQRDGKLYPVTMEIIRYRLADGVRIGSHIADYVNYSMNFQQGITSLMMKMKNIVKYEENVYFVFYEAVSYCLYKRLHQLEKANYPKE